MTHASVDLSQIASRLSDRHVGRTEANVQSDLHLFLRVAPFELDAADVMDIVLESPAGQRRRIDVEVGHTVFEVKRDLRTGNVRSDAVDQLAGYVRDRTNTLRQRYVGVLTDGAEWHLYYLSGDQLHLVSSLELAPNRPDTEALTVWLESVLGTASQITPTPTEIARRLGANSPAHDLDVLELTTLYQKYRDHPEVQLKRELWAKLLVTALGTKFGDQDSLFVEHTLLVATAEIIAHAVVGIDPTDFTIAPSALLGGALFANSQVGGVVEADFFDWIAEIPEGEIFIRTLARNLSRFAWHDVQHDVMKVLYESVIDVETRKSLGEYYTPDWLASEIVETVVTDPLNQRVLDPACGSGTFLFHAVRRYLAAAQSQGIAAADALQGAVSHVVGVDVHPVAVTLARVTYLLAIGVERLQAPDRPPLVVPVYLGDSMQWGQEETLLSTDALTVQTNDGAQLFADELRFPERLLQDAGQFDRLVSEMADRAASRNPGSAVPSLNTMFRLFAVHPDDQPMLTQTFGIMCRLYDEGRDHIWGYYVRNLARPIWLTHPTNRVDVLIGNPPWLAYRFMPATMQVAFRQMSRDRNLWAGAGAAPTHDLSALFVERTTELYLRTGGLLGFVMPLAALTRRPFAGFRQGRYITHGQSVRIAFSRPWDLHLVRPAFFPVPASVVFGQRVEGGNSPLTQPPETWSGRLPTTNASREVERQHVIRTESAAYDQAGAGSKYAARFTQGATIVPRVLSIVERQPTPALGAGAGRVAVRSNRSPKEKPPWKQLSTRTGTVERQFVRPLLIGETLLPYRLRDSLLAVVPWDGHRLLNGADDRLGLYQGLERWWREAETLWNENRSSERMTLLDRLDFRRGLSQQFPIPPHRVVYSASGMYLAAAYLQDERAVVEHTIYWAAAGSAEEARYLVAILNSETMTQRVRPLQARGQHNPRHFDKYAWQVPVPIFDPADQHHRLLAQLSAQAEILVAALDLPQRIAFEALRRRIRQALMASDVGQQIEELVGRILS